MKIIFFGTSNVALPILETLSRKHEILAVVTMPDAKAGRSQEFAESPVSVLANEMKLKILKPEAVKGNNVFRMELQALNADIFVVVSYGKILPNEIINMPKYKSVNVHFSQLPKYRGPSPIQSALLNGDKETGTSIFILDEEADHGPVLAQEAVAIDPDDNYLTLSEKMAFKSAQLILSTVEAYVAGTLAPKAQDDALATQTAHISKSHGQIDWTKAAGEIYNQFRAFYPWPGIWTKWDGRILKIIDCAPIAHDSLPKISEAGLVLDSGIVSCGNGTYLEIKALQLEGKNETSILDFLNGYREFVGSTLI